MVTRSLIGFGWQLSVACSGTMSLAQPRSDAATPTVDPAGTAIDLAALTARA